MPSQHLYDRYGRLFDPDADKIERPTLTRAQLRGASSWLLNVRGAPGVGPSWQGDRESVYQNLPLDADTLLRWLGGGAYPAGFAIPNVLAIYAMDTASPLVDSLGLGPNLVAVGGLTGRECVGLGQIGSWTSKVGVETVGGADRFAVAADAAFADANNSIVSVLAVLRFRSPLTANGRVLSKRGGAGAWWDSYIQPITSFNLSTSAGNLATVVSDWLDSGWHSVALIIDDVAAIVSLFTDLGDNTSAPAGVGLGNPSLFSLGSWFNGLVSEQFMQCAYLAVCNLTITSAMRANFWRHAQVPTPFLHARTNPLICPISPSRVACYSGGNVGQAAVGYDASLVSAALGNPLGNGYVAEDGATFEPNGSDNIAPIPAGNSTTFPAETLASVDGPSGMRDGVRVTMGAAWSVAAFARTGAIAIVGASNIPWRFDANYRQPPAGAVGTTARLGLYFSGDAGGIEFFTVLTDNASPADWTRNGGAATPVGAGHNTVYNCFGAAANLENCDFGEPAVIKNRATPSLAWRRVGTAAAAVTTTPSIQAANAGNYIYNPLRGEYRRTFAGFPGTVGATLFQFGAAGAAGSMTADYNAGQLRWRGWDSAGALAWTVLCGAIGTGKYQLVFQWDSVSPLRTIGGAYVAVVDVNPALPVILGTALAPWTAQPAAVTPLYLLTDAAGANPWRGFHEEA